MPSDAQDHTASAIEINRGTVGDVGASRVGLVAVSATRPPLPGAMPAATAELATSDEVSGVHVETSWSLGEGMLLPLADGLHRVSRISTPVTSGSRGKVAIDATAAKPSSANAVFVGDAGKLRIGGPDVDAATDLRVLEFSPDTHAPRTATVEWLPAAYARSDTPARLIKQQSVRVGDRLHVGTTALLVKALEGASRDHPAWIEFTLAPDR